jgi:hypothetical protein
MALGFPVDFVGDLQPGKVLADEEPCEGLVPVDSRLSPRNVSSFLEEETPFFRIFKWVNNVCLRRLGTLAVINAPYGFATIWNVVKAWLAKETQEKVQIFGSDYEPFLLQHIETENLPTSLGGKCTCEGQGGCELSNVGPWMIDRKARREKWLRGERDRPGLGLEDLEVEHAKADDNEPTLTAFTESSTPTNANDSQRLVRS